MSTSDKAVITCALTGVLTDPAQHKVPVTPAEMADAAQQAFLSLVIFTTVSFSLPV